MGRGAYILAPRGPVLTAEERAFFAEAEPFGFILFARNVETPDQLLRLTSDLREAVGRHAPVLIDQEGGRVQRLGPPHWRAWPPPLEQVEKTRASAWGMYLRGVTIGHELAGSGIDVACAPLADIAFPDTHPFLRNRCPGTDPATVTTMARAWAEGLLDAGCLPVLKHLPGHGRAQADSHADLPRIDADLATLQAMDFQPFQALADLPMAMTAHLLIPAVDADAPITLSPAGIRLIRETLGFDGLLMSDDISMGALSGDVGSRAARAIAAGCDLVLHCNGELAEMEVVAAGAGALGGPAATRARKAEAARRKPVAIDISALEADLETLLKGAIHA